MQIGSHQEEGHVVLDAMEDVHGWFLGWYVTTSCKPRQGADV